MERRMILQYDRLAADLMKAIDGKFLSWSKYEPEYPGQRLQEIDSVDDSYGQAKIERLGNLGFRLVCDEAEREAKNLADGVKIMRRDKVFYLTPEQAMTLALTNWLEFDENWRYTYELHL